MSKRPINACDKTLFAFFTWFTSPRAVIHNTPPQTNTASANDPASPMAARMIFENNPWIVETPSGFVRRALEPLCVPPPLVWIVGPPCGPMGKGVVIAGGAPIPQATVSRLQFPDPHVASHSVLHTAVSPELRHVRVPTRLVPLSRQANSQR